MAETWEILLPFSKTYVQRCELFRELSHPQLWLGDPPSLITISDTCLSREPLLYAASEHRVVGVPTSVFHTRVRARDDVSASVQRLQPKRVVPVKLSAGQRRRSMMVQTEQTGGFQLNICLQLTSWFVISTMFSLLSKNAKWLWTRSRKAGNGQRG